MLYNITPVPKPRMTQRDRWKKRDCVLRYHAFKDRCRAYNVDVQDSGCHVIFHMPMPKSWSKKKRAKMNGQPHKQKPDVDNLLKALLDACKKEDCTVWRVAIEKRWSEAGAIEINKTNGENT